VDYFFAVLLDPLEAAITGEFIPAVTGQSVG